jgi:hypothetical protein
MHSPKRPSKPQRGVSKPSPLAGAKVSTPRDRKKTYAANRRGSPQVPPGAPVQDPANRRAKALFTKHPRLESP